jgi:hypothetical protein
MLGGKSLKLAIVKACISFITTKKSDDRIGFIIDCPNVIFSRINRKRSVV